MMVICPQAGHWRGSHSLCAERGGARVFGPPRHLRPRGRRTDAHWLRAGRLFARVFDATGLQPLRAAATRPGGSGGPRRFLPLPHLPSGACRESLRPFSGPWPLSPSLPAGFQRRTLWVEPGVGFSARHRGGRLVRCGRLVAGRFSQRRGGAGSASQPPATQRTLPAWGTRPLPLFRRRPQW